MILTSSHARKMLQSLHNAKPFMSDGYGYETGFDLTVSFEAMMMSGNFKMKAMKIIIICFI